MKKNAFGNRASQVKPTLLARLKHVSGVSTGKVALGDFARVILLLVLADMCLGTFPVRDINSMLKNCKTI